VIPPCREDCCDTGTCLCSGAVFASEPASGEDIAAEDAAAPIDATHPRPTISALAARWDERSIPPPFAGRILRIFEQSLLL
jgi:hypothetical protein